MIPRAGATLIPVNAIMTFLIKNKYDATIIWERRSHLLVGICVVKNVIADVELI